MSQALPRQSQGVKVALMVSIIETKFSAVIIPVRLITPFEDESSDDNDGSDNDDSRRPRQ